LKTANLCLSADRPTPECPLITQVTACQHDLRGVECLYRATASLLSSIF
jgi:hypothetical protein